MKRVFILAVTVLLAFSFGCNAYFKQDEQGLHQARELLPKEQGLKTQFSEEDIAYLNIKKRINLEVYKPSYTAGYVYTNIVPDENKFNIYAFGVSSENSVWYKKAIHIFMFSMA